MSFQTEMPRAGLSLTLGTEVTHPRDVAVSYGTMANERSSTSATRRILRVTDSAGRGSRRAVRATAGRGGGLAPGRVRDDRHPGLATRTRNQNPIWGDFAVAGGRRHAPPGDAQDGHQQRRQRPRRVRLHRTAGRGRTRRRRVRARRRSVERQQRRLAGADPGEPGPVDGRGRADVERLPDRGQLATGRCTTSRDRPASSTPRSTPGAACVRRSSRPSA